MGDDRSAITEPGIMESINLRPLLQKDMKTRDHFEGDTNVYLYVSESICDIDEETEYRTFCQNLKLKGVRRRECKVDRSDCRGLNEYSIIRSVGIRNNCSIQITHDSYCDNDALFNAVAKSLLSQGYTWPDWTITNRLRAGCQKILEQKEHLYAEKIERCLGENETIQDYIRKVGEGQKTDDLTIRLIVDSQCGLAISMITIDTRNGVYEENGKGFYAETPVVNYCGRGRNRARAFVAKVIDSEGRIKYFHIVPLMSEIDKFEMRVKKRNNDRAYKNDVNDSSVFRGFSASTQFATEDQVQQNCRKRAMHETEDDNNGLSHLSYASMRKKQIATVTRLEVEESDSNVTSSVECRLEKNVNDYTDLLDFYRKELQEYHEFTKTITLSEIKEEDMISKDLQSQTLNEEFMLIVEKKNECWVDRTIVDRCYDTDDVSMIYAVMRSLSLQGHCMSSLDIAHVYKLCVEVFDRDHDRYRRLLKPILEKCNLTESQYLENIGRIREADDISMLLIANALNISICTFVVSNLRRRKKGVFFKYHVTLFGNKMSMKRAFVFEIATKYHQCRKAIVPNGRKTLERLALQNMREYTELPFFLNKMKCQ